ncbi:MAG: hypothetical protein IKB75_01135 [Clostridia bacterium]|nr:hypothetical protein [Clostridia bacterium]
MIKINGLKKTTVLVLIISMILSGFSFAIYATGNSVYDFPNFTEADSMEFVEEHNIEIPTGLQQADYLAVFTRNLILQAYEAPNVPFCFNFTPTQEYAEAIRMAVRSYMNLGALPMTVSDTPYTLQYNTVQDEDGNWVTSGGVFQVKWLSYNCYAFAINRVENPPFYQIHWLEPSENGRQYRPGNMSIGPETLSGMESFDVWELANIVCNDLTVMGYSNISLSYSIPTINSSQELICIRTILQGHDYHFMKYDLETDAWYHKPGPTAVLKYNYVPSNDLLWYNESFRQDGAYPSYGVYDSDIIFITYDKNKIDIGQNTTTSTREYIEDNKDVLLEINVGDTGHYEIDITSDYNFEYELYDENFDFILSGSGTSVTECLYAEAGEKYYLRVNFDDFRVTFIHYIDVLVEPAISHFYEYTWYSNTQHNFECCCGYFATGAHVVPAGSFTGGNKFAICLFCGGPATSGMVGTNSIQTLYHTANGSYILPNGVIVLVDEDIEAYLNGELVFTLGEVA